MGEKKTTKKKRKRETGIKETGEKTREDRKGRQFSKTQLFQLTFLENFLGNSMYKKQKKSIKDQRSFYSNTFFNVFANSVSAHSKICSRFSYQQNDIIFFIPSVGDLSEIEECLYLTTTMECNSFQISFFSQSSKCKSNGKLFKRVKQLISE